LGSRRTRWLGPALGAVAALYAGAAAAGFVDVLDTPAQVSPLAEQVLLESVARAGSRVVAVGQRGHVVVSRDRGGHWAQAAVPVSSDLTSVYFVDEKHGWAVGHDGVILASTDGGLSWRVQLDGRKAAALVLAGMERRAAEEPGSEAVKKLLDEARRYPDQGADKPFLDVWFADARTGYAVGAYNLVFRTVDGGATWESWFDRTDNPRLLNLYAIRPAAGELYIAGENGLVLKLDTAAQRFRAVRTPYNGSFFGVADAGTRALVFGLRGNVYGSDDGGRTWDKVDAGLTASVVAATRGRDGHVLLADAGGRVAASADDAHTFERLPLEQPVPIAGIAALDGGRYALVGPRGVVVTQAASH
jgi:photosystem II stability/assembly factor-like uncharacterized protein